MTVASRRSVKSPFRLVTEERAGLSPVTSFGYPAHLYLIKDKVTLVSRRCMKKKSSKKNARIEKKPRGCFRWAVDAVSESPVLFASADQFFFSRPLQQRPQSSSWWDVSGLTAGNPPRVADPDSPSDNTTLNLLHPSVISQQTRDGFSSVTHTLPALQDGS